MWQPINFSSCKWERERVEVHNEDVPFPHSLENLMRMSIIVTTVVAVIISKPQNATIRIRVAAKWRRLVSNKCQWVALGFTLGFVIVTKCVILSLAPEAFHTNIHILSPAKCSFLLTNTSISIYFIQPQLSITQGASFCYKLAQITVIRIKNFRQINPDSAEYPNGWVRYYAKICF